MFDLFGMGVGIERLSSSDKHHLIHYLSLVMVLIETGVIDEDELEVARARATSLVDQLWAEKQTEAKEKFDKEYPHVRRFLSKLFGTEGIEGITDPDEETNT